MSLQLPFKKPSKQVLIGLSVVATSAIGIALYGFSQVGQSNSKPSTQPTIPAVKKVTALGRLEPETEVSQVSAPLALNGDRIAQLLVKEGDLVKAGQTIAILDSRDRLQNTLAQAKKQVNVAQAKLAQVKAGAKTGEIQAQQARITRLEIESQKDIEAQAATVARLQAQLRNAEVENKRYQELYLEGAIAASQRDSKFLTLAVAQKSLVEAQSLLNRKQSANPQELNEAKANLDRIAEVRPVDIRVAQTEVDNALAGSKLAQTNVEEAHIRAPMAGHILKIRTRLGEKISNSGIADLGQTGQMVAVAEIYQTDIGKIRIGQQATITSQAFPGELKGKVSRIGLQVSKQNVFSNQPGENLDRRVVEVKIRLTPEDSKRVAGLTNLQVQTAIQL
jgi:HlyD family secretion protein